MPWQEVTDPNELAAAQAQLGGATGSGTAGKPTAPKAPTEAQAKAYGYYLQMKAAAESMNKMGAYSPNEVTTALDNGGMFGGVMRRTIDPQAQRALNAQRAFSNVLLRQESGAAISQGEVDNRTRILFPQPNDLGNPQALQDKENQRQAAMDAMRAAAGPLADKVPRLPARVRNDADYSMLPKGAQYIGPDGHTRVKK